MSGNVFPFISRPLLSCREDDKSPAFSSFITVEKCLNLGKTDMFLKSTSLNPTRWKTPENTRSISAILCVSRQGVCAFNVFRFLFFVSRKGRWFCFLISERNGHYEMSLYIYDIYKTKDYHHYAIDCDIKITYMCVVHSFVELVFTK